MRPAAALRSGFAVTALTTTVFLSCGVAQYYREESKPSHKESIAAASVVSDAIAPVMVTYTDDYSINRAYDMWYINQHPRLKRNIGSVRTDSTTTALEGVLNLASGHKDSIVGIIGSRISSKGDTTLLNAAIQLADSGRAVRLRHFDSCESVFTWSDLIEQPDDVKRLELRAGFLDQLSENWDVEPFKKTFLIHSVREAEVKLAGHNTTKTRELESFILTHSRQELLRAIILQHQERYAEAARSLRIAIDRNPSYPLTYSHLAELYAEWQQRDGGVMLLYRALNAMCEAREAVPAEQLPAWFSNREIYFADQLKTAIIREKSAMPLE